MIIKLLCVAAATTAVASTCFAQVTAEKLATTEIRTEKVGDNL